MMRLAPDPYIVDVLLRGAQKRLNTFTLLTPQDDLRKDLWNMDQVETWQNRKQGNL